MKILVAAILFSFVTSTTFAQEKQGTRRVIYTYKQHEKFDLDDLSIEGDQSAPSDISISPIHEKKYQNKLPYKRSFNREIQKVIERVR